MNDSLPPETPSAHAMLSLPIRYEGNDAEGKIRAMT